MVEKFIAKKLSQFYEAKEKLHKRQMEGKKHCSTIDIASLMIHKVHKIWETKQVAITLLMEVKKAFNHVSQTKLLWRMVDLGINNDLIG